MSYGKVHYNLILTLIITLLNEMSVFSLDITFESLNYRADILLKPNKFTGNKTESIINIVRVGRS